MFTPATVFSRYWSLLQGTGNSLTKDILKVLKKADSELLKKLIDTLPAKNARDKTLQGELRRTYNVIKELEKQRAESLKPIETTIKEYTKEVGQSVNINFGKLLPEDRKYKPLTKSAINTIIDYAPVNGQSISDWFQNYLKGDLQRITQAVNRGMVEDLSVSNIVKLIMGTKENNYKDGVLETSRNSATTIARTIINGSSNNYLTELCNENADILDGIQFEGTLDGRTCPYCGSLDGTIWQVNDEGIKRPPLHPNCRCHLIPYIKVEGLEGSRPSANADFDKLAQDSYNDNAKEKGWSRRWDDLSSSTKQKYYYQAQKDYEERTGKPAYSKVKGNTNFEEYFEKQSASFKKSWLGETRYELYKEGKITLDDLINPDNGYLVPISQLKNL